MAYPLIGMSTRTFHIRFAQFPVHVLKSYFMLKTRYKTCSSFSTCLLFGQSIEYIIFNAFCTELSHNWQAGIENAKVNEPKQSTLKCASITNSIFQIRALTTF